MLDAACIARVRVLFLIPGQASQVWHCKLTHVLRSALIYAQESCSCNDQQAGRQAGLSIAGHTFDKIVLRDVTPIISVQIIEMSLWTFRTALESYGGRPTMFWPSLSLRTRMLTWKT